MKYFIIVLICLVTLVCFAQEPVKNEITIKLMLTDGEMKAILHNYTTIEFFVQQLVQERASYYMQRLAKEYTSKDLETFINALDIKTRIEILAEQVKPK